MTPLPTQSQHPHQDAFSLLQARKIADWSGMSQGKEFSSLQIALRTGIASFLPSVPIFLPEQANDLPKAGIFLIWRGEDWGKGSPHSRILLPCTSQPLHGAFCHYFTSLPSHALGPFTPLSLWQPDGFGLPDKGEQALSYHRSNCTQAAARPEICAPLIPLYHSGHWAWASPSQPWTPGREEVNSACKAQ